MAKLTAKTVEAAKYTDRPRKLADGGGLYLHIKRTSKTWCYGFRLDGRPLVYTIGPQKLISLSEARQLHQDAKRWVLRGKSPVDIRREEKRLRIAQVQSKKQEQINIGHVVDRWFSLREKNWAASNSSKIKYRLNKHLPTTFLTTPIADVTPNCLLQVLRTSESRSIDLIHRLKGYLQDSFDLAVAEELIAVNPVRHPMIAEAIPKRPNYKNFPHIKQPQLIGEILVKLDNHQGMPSVSAALQLLPYLFTRPGELRRMYWHEIEWEARLWRIPAHRMKARREHLVPLSDQAFKILKRHKAHRKVINSDELQNQLVFPGKDGTKPFSDMTLANAMRKLNIGSDILVPHGWRRTASTALNERSFFVDGTMKRFSPDAIEIHLAHKIGGVRGVYNAAEYLEERRIVTIP